MKSYRIYTERKNLNWICQIVSEHFPGFTIFRTEGFWQGKSEHSICIEIITDKTGAEYYIRQICHMIQGYNKQSEVIYTKSEIEMEVL